MSDEQPALPRCKHDYGPPEMCPLCKAESELPAPAGSGYVEVKSIEVKIGDEFWCPYTKRWLPVEVRNQQMGVCIGDYLVRRKIQKASSPNDEVSESAPERKPC